MPSARYTKIKSIGSGSFGTVWLVRDNTGAQLIMKEVNLAGLPRREQRATMNEVKVLQRLKHEHIVAYKDSFVSDEEKLCIVMEWASGGDLASLISRKKKTGKRFSEAEIITILYQICSALAYCHHDVKMLHRDLKPANIFLGAGGEVKVGDFGISKILPNSFHLAHTQCGTPLYMSPEMARGQAYTKAADAWAVGCILFELMSLTAPWVGQLGRGAAAGGIQGLMRKISRGDLDTSSLRRHYSDELCALLHALLARRSSERPSISTVLRWPLMQRHAPSHLAPVAPQHDAPTFEPSGADSHAAAQAIQRSFRRVAPRPKAADPQPVAEECDATVRRPNPPPPAPYHPRQAWGEPQAHAPPRGTQRAIPQYRPPPPQQYVPAQWAPPPAPSPANDAVANAINEYRAAKAAVDAAAAWGRVAPVPSAAAAAAALPPAAMHPQPSAQHPPLYGAGYYGHPQPAVARPSDLAQAKLAAGEAVARAAAAARAAEAAEKMARAAEAAERANRLNAAQARDQEAARQAYVHVGNVAASKIASSFRKSLERRRLAAAPPKARTPPPHEPTHAAPARPAAALRPAPAPAHRPAPVARPSPAPALCPAHAPVIRPAQAQQAAPAPARQALRFPDAPRPSARPSDARVRGPSAIEKHAIAAAKIMRSFKRSQARRAAEREAAELDAKEEAAEAAAAAARQRVQAVRLAAARQQREAIAAAPPPPKPAEPIKLAGAEPIKYYSRVLPAQPVAARRNPYPNAAPAQQPLLRADARVAIARGAVQYTGHADARADAQGDAAGKIQEQFRCSLDRKRMAAMAHRAAPSPRPAAAHQERVTLNRPRREYANHQPKPRHHHQLADLDRDAGAHAAACDAVMNAVKRYHPAVAGAAAPHAFRQDRISQLAQPRTPRAAPTAEPTGRAAADHYAYQHHPDAALARVAHMRAQAAYLAKKASAFGRAPAAAAR